MPAKGICTLLIFIQSGCRITRVCNLRFGLLIFIVYRSTVDIPDGQGGPTGPLSIRRVPAMPEPIKLGALWLLIAR